MSAFLNLLKNKNIGIQIDSNFGTPDQTLVNLDTGETVAPAVDVAPKFIPQPIHVKVERVLNRNRLDVIYSAKPDQAVIDDLKANGFRFNPESKAWYNKDSLANRLYIANRYNVPELLQDNFNDDPASETNPSTSGAELSDANLSAVEASKIDDNDQPMQSYESEAYSTFKRQVNALQTELKLDAADLMLKAVSCLYNETFKIN